MSNAPQAQKPQSQNDTAPGPKTTKVPGAATDVTKPPGAKENMTNEGGSSCSPSDKKSTKGGCN